MNESPGSTLFFEATFPTDRSANGTGTIVVLELPPSGSDLPSAEETVAVLITGTPAESGERVPLIVTVAAWPTGRFPCLTQVSSPPAGGSAPHENPGATTEVGLKSSGITSLTTTSEAGEGPWLVALRV